MSFVQMERYLTAADYAMRQAMSAAFERPEKSVRKIYARDAIGARYQPRENGTLPDRLMFPVLDSHAQPEVRAGRAPNTSPETREREAVGKVSSIFSDAGQYGWGFNAPVAGRYRIRLKGYSVWVSGGGIGRWFYEGQGAEKAPVYWLPVWHRPNADEIWPGRNNEPIGIYAQSSGQTRPVGVMDFTPKPTVGEIEVQLAGGESIRSDAMRLFRTRVNGSDEQYVNPLATQEGMPGYAVQWLEVTGPLEDAHATSGYKLLFGDLPMRRLGAGEKGGVPLETVAPNSNPPVGGLPGGGLLASAGPGAFLRSPISNVTVEVHFQNAAAGCRAAAAQFHPDCVPAAHRGTRSATVPRAVQAGVRARLRLRALDAHRLHRRAGLAGLRVRRGAAGQARRLGARHAPVALPLELHARRRAARPRRKR